jgi:hypothetical protein
MNLLLEMKMHYTNRKYYTTPYEAYDKFCVAVNVQESYEAVMPKFFGQTSTPPFFEDPFPNNMAYANVSLRILVDIHTGGYIYELRNPEEDVPRIVEYLGWFIDSFRSVQMDKDRELVYNKIKQVYAFYNNWYTKVMEAREKEKTGNKKIITFGEGFIK